MIARQRFGRRDQRRRLPRIAQQQPRAGNGRERNRQLELGIISAAGAHIGVRPVLIEDIFALAVALGLRSEEHTSELPSLMRNSYAVFCLNKKNHEDVGNLDIGLRETRTKLFVST